MLDVHKYMHYTKPIKTRCAESNLDSIKHYLEDNIMANSQTFDEAKAFFDKNNNSILELLLEELKGEIEYQSEYDQVAVWFKEFSLCYQNGDMNGNKKGQAIWNNDGADSGVKVLRDLIANDSRFSPLYAEDEYWSFEYVDETVALFCDEFAERNSIADMFSDEAE